MRPKSIASSYRLSFRNPPAMAFADRAPHYSWIVAVAGSLAVFRMYGANRPVRCGYHAGRYDYTRCGGVLSGELLVNPNADCGRR